MLKYIFQIVIGLALAGLLAVAFHYSLADAPAVAETTAPTPEPEPLAAIVTRAMDTAKPKTSAGRRALHARLIVQVAEQTFTDRERQEYWISVLGTESSYNPGARSPVGAVGLGQIMPEYRNDFARSCGLPDFDASDVQDDYTNLVLSACQFKSLIVQNGGSIPLALVAYNAGSNSASLKKLKAGANPAHEPAAYLSKVWAGQVRNAKKKK